MTLPLGTRLGPYEALDLVGAGGMGEVYRARDPRLAAISVVRRPISTSWSGLRRAAPSLVLGRPQ